MTDKQRSFIEHYLTCWNATKAARLAGYAVPDVDGHRVRECPEVQALIQERLSELAMGADEVLQRLAQIARNEASDYIRLDENNRPYFDVAALQEDGKEHLVKGISYNKAGDAVVQTFDTQAALLTIGKHLKLFPERVEHGNLDDKPFKIYQGFDPERV